MFVSAVDIYKLLLEIKILFPYKPQIRRAVGIIGGINPVIWYLSTYSISWRWHDHTISDLPFFNPISSSDDYYLAQCIYFSIGM